MTREFTVLQSTEPSDKLTEPRLECAVTHLTLQEVIDRVNNNLSYYSICGRKSERSRGERWPHHPEFYIPRVTRMFAGFMFGAYRAAGMTTKVQKANIPYSVSS